MTSELFQNSKYSKDSLESASKIKIVKKLNSSVKKLIRNLYEPSDPNYDKLDKLDKQIDILLELADRLNDRNKFCRGCFTISDSVKVCHSCWQIDLCDGCAGPTRILKKCSGCKQQVCWKKKCEMCRQCASKLWKD